MNNWHALSYIALGFGFIFFLNALYIGSQYGNMPINQYFLIILPWIDYAAFSWIVAVVAMVRGSERVSSA